MYTRFKRTPLTKEELIRYIGVLLLFSVNSVRNFRKAWERKSSQVRITTVNKSYVQVCIGINHAFYLLLCRFLFVYSIWWPEADLKQSILSSIWSRLLKKQEMLKILWRRCAQFMMPWRSNPRSCTSHFVNYLLTKGWSSQKPGLISGNIYVISLLNGGLNSGYWQIPLGTHLTTTCTADVSGVHQFLTKD